MQRTSSFAPSTRFAADEQLFRYVYLNKLIALPMCASVPKEKAMIDRPLVLRPFHWILPGFSLAKRSSAEESSLGRWATSFKGTAVLQRRIRFTRWRIVKPWHPPFECRTGFLFRSPAIDSYFRFVRLGGLAPNFSAYPKMS